MRRRPLLVAVTALALAACSSSPEKKEQASAKQPAGPPPEAYRVRFETTKGPFVVEVKREYAPKGADRFYQLVTDGFYDGARFYRVRPGFVVQWGISKDPKLNQLWKQMRLSDDPVKIGNERGTICFATDGPDTRTTEVYINLADNRRLDARGFSPFGKVVEGMDVVDRFFDGYGEVRPRGGGVDPEKYMAEGDSYIQRQWNRLDQIQTAKVITQ